MLLHLFGFVVVTGMLAPTKERRIRQMESVGRVSTLRATNPGLSHAQERRERATLQVVADDPGALSVPSERATPPARDRFASNTKRAARYGNGVERR